jgi:Reverse transcriptase (RNA-dependent DNA polymerase)
LTNQGQNDVFSFSISHFPFLSKLTEKVVKLRLTEYLSINNLLNSFQPAYIKHHSTETTQLSLHDHTIEAMSHQEVTFLTLLDLSAAFDTIDHSILIERLSTWFDITFNVLGLIISSQSFFLCQS